MNKSSSESFLLLRIFNLSIVIDINQTNKPFEVNHHSAR
ncbi:hypothetical protein P20652_2008 [Pseudoalteromonas sp. BSi20652]|nr:hypothetical protein P20652_2008 [Pseudoalteromonas sp. BSi20652]